MLVIVPGMIVIDISGTLPTAYDIGRRHLERAGLQRVETAPRA